MPAANMEAVQLERLSKSVGKLAAEVKRLQSRSGLIVPINSLAPEPFDVVREFKVVVQPSGREYLATFFDANINASGASETDAVANLKDVMVGVFDYLGTLPKKKLGIGPARQLATLRTYLKKRL